MKKILFGIVTTGLILSFAGVVSAQAKVECVAGDHKIWSNDNSYTIGCIDGKVWNDAMAKANSNIGFGQTNMIHVPRGGVVVLKNGIIDRCPTWYPMGCVIDPSLVK